MTCSTGQRPLLIPTERASFAITPPTVVARLLFQDMPSTIGPGTVLANSQEGAESVQKTSGNEQTRQTHSNGSAEQAHSQMVPMCAPLCSVSSVKSTGMPRREVVTT